MQQVAAPGVKARPPFGQSKQLTPGDLDALKENIEANQQVADTCDGYIKDAKPVAQQLLDQRATLIAQTGSHFVDSHDRSLARTFSCIALGLGVLGAGAALVSGNWALAIPAGSLGVGLFAVMAPMWIRIPGSEKDAYNKGVSDVRQNAENLKQVIDAMSEASETAKQARSAIQVDERDASILQVAAPSRTARPIVELPGAVDIGGVRVPVARTAQPGVSNSTVPPQSALRAQRT